MWSLQACAVCLSTGVKLHSLKSGTLRHNFISVSGLRMTPDDGLPQYLCMECTAYVNKFMKFREKCHRAHYVLKQILCRDKEITLFHLENINRDHLHIAPNLSYMNLNRTNYCQMQYKLISFFRKGISEPAGLIPVTHCVIDPQERNIDLDMKVTDDFNVKTELNEYDKIEQKSIDIEFTQQNGDYKPTVKSNILQQALEMIADDDFNDGDNYESLTAQPNNESTSEVFGQAVQISFKEAKAAYEVLKYCSKGKFKCFCGKSFETKDILYSHSQKHNKELSGNYECEICNVFFKSMSLLEAHMLDKHTYKYLCKMCPEVSFNKRLAKSHYMKHINSAKAQMKPKKKRKKYVVVPQKRKKTEATKSKKKETLPKNFLVYTPQSQEEQYRLIEARKLSRNYLEAKFRCELCYRGFRLTLTYNKHMAKHDPTISGVHKCDMCKQYFRNTRLMYKHMTMYHTRKYSCQSCDFVTTNKGQALNHYKWHMNVTYDCPHCDKKFSKISTQLTHIRFKHPGTDVCNICGHSFVSSSGLNCHQVLTHSKEEIDLSDSLSLNPDPSHPLYCADCKMQFATEEARITHLGSSKNHVNINFSSQSVMSSNRRISRAECKIARSSPPATEPRGRRPARGLPGSTVLNTGNATSTNCDVCGCSLANDVMARRHYEAEHPGTEFLKRYMCDICGHTTKQYANLLVHMRTHTREKPYECPYCDRRFSMTSNRDRHLVVHTGEKRFQCQHCSRRFTQSTAVKLHIQTVHMKIPYKPWDKKNRKRRKEAQMLANSAGVEVTEQVAPVMSAVVPVPQHKLLIGDTQAEFITYITYAQEQ